MNLTLAAVLTAGILCGILCYLWGRRTGRSRLVALEARLARLDEQVSRRYHERLSLLRRHLGILYLNGLPYAEDRTVARLFEAGIRLAEQRNWEGAFARWAEAQSKAKDAEAVALGWLCGACQLAARRTREARNTLTVAATRARATHDRSGLAAVQFLLGSIAMEEQAWSDARLRFTEASRLAESVGRSDLVMAALTRLAEAAANSADSNQAIALHRRVLRVAEAQEDLSTVIRSYQAIGDILRSRGDLDQARAAHEDALHVARQARSRNLEAEQLMAIGTIHRDQGDGKRALEILERALRLYRDLRHLRGQARALYELSQTYEQREQHDISQEYRERTLDAAQKAGDFRLVLLSSRQLAEVCIGNGALDRALTFLSTALDAAKRTGADLSRTTVQLADLYLLHGEVEHAHRLLADALSSPDRRDTTDEAALLVRQLRIERRLSGTLPTPTQLSRALDLAKSGSGPRAAEVQVDVAQLLLESGDREHAAELIAGAVPALRRSGSRRALARALLALSLTETNSALARQHGEDALRLAHQIDDKRLEAEAFLALGRTELRAENSPNACRLLEQARTLFQNIGERQGEAESLLGLSEAKNALGDIAGAHANLTQAAQVFRELNDSAGLAATADMRRRLPPMSHGVQFISQDNRLTD